MKKKTLRIITLIVLVVMLLSAFSSVFASAVAKGDATMTLVKDEALLSLLLSTRADYGIHCENWSLQDCIDYFNSFGFQVTEDSFKEYYTLIVTEPSYYAKYGMGYVWTQKTMDDMHSRYPNKTDLEIHTAYLDSLTGTFEQINESMIKKLG